MPRTRDGRGALVLVPGLAFALLVTPASPQISAQQPAVASPQAAAGATRSATTLSDAAMERFLREAKILKTKGTKKGITNSTQATLSDGTLTHDAHIQTIDEHKKEFRSAMGVELDFRDSWTFNVAAYKLDRMIGLNLVPVSIAGRYRSMPASITWWVDDVMMDEGDRMKKKAQPPDNRQWNQQQLMMRLFDELIANTDRNVGNMLYTSDWRLWAIDHTRAFRKHTTLKRPSVISRCERQVFDRLKALDREALKRELGKYLDDGHIKSMLTRRDLIVQKLESLGPTALFDRTPQVSAER